MKPRLLLACVAFTLVACGGGTPPNEPADATMLGPDLSMPGGTLCSDPKADTWALPIAKTSANGSFQVSLVSADYSPPVIGTNAWTFTVADATGTPLTGATVSVKPWMPYMGHGTSTVPVVAPGAAAGNYAVSALYYYMAGVWTATLTITSGATMDTVVYGVCLAD